MAFRAFYALPADSFTTSGGQHTNAVYGFLSMLAKQLETEKPTHLAIAFDAARESFRNELYPEYKGKRDETPAQFKGQVELLKAVLDAMGIVSITVPDFEADDVLATLAKEGREAGYHVLVASGDRDTFQLVGEDVTVLYPGRSTSDLTYMTPQVVEERYGVTPSRYPELAALVGEDADNLPGVPGVGPKTAAQWLKRFDGLENLIENADKIGGKRGEAFREHLEDVERNRKLNRLVDDMDLSVTPGQCIPAEPDRPELESLFNTLQFTTLRDRVYRSMAPLWGEDEQAFGSVQASEEAVDDVPSQPAEMRLITASTDLASLLQQMVGQPVALWGEGRLAPTEPRLDLLTAATQSDVVIIEVAQLGEKQEAALAGFLSSHDQFIVHDGKALGHAVSAEGWELAPPSFDIALGAYLCRPEQRRYGLEQLVPDYLGGAYESEDDGAIFSLDLLEGGETAGAPTPSQLKAAQNALTVLALQQPIEQTLKDRDGLDLLHDIEMPVSVVLEQMEDVGIAIDVDRLRSLRTEIDQEVQAAAADAYAAIGHETHLGSPKQLQVVLFEELGMPKTRRTKTGYTTDAEALADLYEKTGHPFLEALLLHRERIKLVQMIDGLLGEVQPDGRIHTTFSQTAAATGRIASSDPNLQNIPIRTETGRRIREAFVAGPRYEELMSVDYSQIEMRIMAHLSKDAGLIDAFNSGEDLHRTMASQVFEVQLDQVDSDLRSRIKATSYGLAYGLSPYGLSRQLGVSVEEARTLHKQYFERFGGVGRYLREVVEEARDRGYTETMFGRRRYFPQLTSTNRRVREMAERAALNAPIQGSAADLIKVAMIDVSKRLRDGRYKSRMLLQVHDELVLEIAPGESNEVAQILTDAMGASAVLKVPLDVAVGRGHSWMQAAH